MYPLYQDASKVLELMEQRKGTANRLSLNHSIRNKKACLAIAAETSRYAAVLQECMEVTGIDKQQHNYKPWLIKVLVYELLLGNKKITGGGAGPRLVKENKEKLADALAMILKRNGVSSAIGLLPESERDSIALPKYARVNTFKTSVGEVIASLTAAGWQETSFEAFLKAIDAEAEYKSANGRTIGTGEDKKEQPRLFARDKDLEEVLLFPPDAKLKHDDALITSCQLRLQDKASCLPAHILAASRRPLRLALDACAAPGNKTTHLAALLRSCSYEEDGRHTDARAYVEQGGSGGGKVIALDVDKKRCELLRQTVSIMGANKSVSVMNKDFLKIDPSKEPFCQVDAIMLDPSCSGSGIRGRSDAPQQQGSEGGDVQQQRLLNLCAFQTKALTHALSFPNVRRVVYSTCSVHREEDEDVVEACLTTAGGRFRLERILPQWQRRGLPVFDGAECCVRVTQQDRAMGFFVACLVRADDDESETMASEGRDALLGRGRGAGEAVKGGSAAKRGGGDEHVNTAITARRCSAQGLVGATSEVQVGSEEEKPAEQRPSKARQGTGVGKRGRGEPRVGADAGAGEGEGRRRRGIKSGLLLQRFLARGLGRSSFY